MFLKCDLPLAAIVLPTCRLQLHIDDCEALGYACSPSSAGAWLSPRPQ